MVLKIGIYYRLAIEPQNFQVDAFVDENYGIVHFVDNQVFRLAGITLFQDVNGKDVKYLGMPSGVTSEALISIETKFGNVKMIVATDNLWPITIPALPSSELPICVCDMRNVLSSVGCQCGAFQKEQAMKAERLAKK